MTVMPHHCAKCPARWSGHLTAHCAACHQTFTGLGAFDRHRDGSHTSRQGRFCLTPGKAGLVLADRLYPCWGLPNTADTFMEDDFDGDT